MHRVLLLLAACLALLLSSCASVSLVKAWRSPEAGPPRSFRTVLVAGKLLDNHSRISCEHTIAAHLQRHGVIAHPAGDFLVGEEKPSWQALAEAVGRAGAEAVVVLSVIPAEGSATVDNRDKSVRYVTTYPEEWTPSLFPHWDLYSYYGLTPFFHPDSAQSDPNFCMLRAALFETENGRLIWTGRMDAVAVGATPTDDWRVARLVADSLAGEKLIPEEK